jgi:GNAT superfamily N-acetyltransferase
MRLPIQGDTGLFRIVRAALQDAQVLAEVQARAFAPDAARYGDGPPGYDSVAWQIAAMESSVYYKILAGDRIIGGVVLRDQGHGEYYLHRLFVAPDFQKRGAASQALAFLEATFPARRWTLHSPHRSRDNHRFYERRGYRKIGEVRLDEKSLPEGFLLFTFEKIMSRSADED